MGTPTRDLMLNTFNGVNPVLRQNRGKGESEYYFFKPFNGDPNTPLSQLPTADVPDGTDPYAFRDAGYKTPSLTDIGSGLTTEINPITGTGLNTSLTNNSTPSLTDQTGIGSNSLNTASSNTPPLFGSTKTNTDNPWAGLRSGTTPSTTTNPWAELQDTIKLYNNTGNGVSSNTSFSKNVPSNSWYDKSQDFTNGVYQGATLGFSDELNGLGYGLVYGLGDAMTGYKDGTFGGGFNRGYQYGRGKSRNENTMSQQRNGGLYLAGEVAGSAVNPINKPIGRYVGNAKSFTNTAVRGAEVGAGLGGIYGVGSSEADTIQGVLGDAGYGATWGAGVGGVGGAAGYGLQKGVKELQYSFPAIQESFDDINRYGSKALPFKETFLNNRGLNKFTDQMRTKNFEDVTFGRMYPDLINEANEVLKRNNLNPYSTDKLRVLSDVAKHIYNQRVVGGKTSPLFLRRSLKKALFDPNSIVSESTKWPHIQSVTSNQGIVGGRSFIAPHSKTGEPLLKTVYPAEKGRY